MPPRRPQSTCRAPRTPRISRSATERDKRGTAHRSGWQRAACRACGHGTARAARTCRTRTPATAALRAPPGQGTTWGSVQGWTLGLQTLNYPILGPPSFAGVRQNHALVDCTGRFKHTPCTLCIPRQRCSVVVAAHACRRACSRRSRGPPRQTSRCCSSARNTERRLRLRLAGQR